MVLTSLTINCVIVVDDGRTCYTTDIMNDWSGRRRTVSVETVRTPPPTPHPITPSESRLPIDTGYGIELDTSGRQPSQQIQRSPQRRNVRSLSESNIGSD